MCHTKPSVRGKPITLQIIKVEPGYADTAETDLRFGRDGRVDPRYDLSFLECGGRKIVPVSAEGVGKNFLSKMVYDTPNGADPGDR
jgi:hypothetical protein